MNYSTFHLVEKDDTTNEIQLFPTYQRVITTNKNNNHQRTQSGKLNSYRKKDAIKTISLPLTYVSQSDVDNINSLWLSQKVVLFILNKDESTIELFQCLISNKSNPFSFRSGFETDEYSGVLFLQSIQGEIPVFGLPFTLNDATLGILNGTNNLLL